MFRHTSHLRLALTTVTLLAFSGRLSVADTQRSTPEPSPVATTLVPTGIGPRALSIATPDAKESVAGQGWRLRARVIVRLDAAVANDKPEATPAPIAASLLALGLQADVRRAWAGPGDLADFWLLDVASIAQAIALADALALQPGVVEASVDAMRPRALRSNVPTDPGFARQWFINAPAGIGSLNAIPAWKAGITGAGVTVGVIEEGFNIDHPDLVTSVNLAASQDPINGYTFIDHTTACAGLIAMSKNAIGGAGVAYGAKVSRIYYGFDSDTAAAFVYRNDLNAIKSNSYGPPDIASISSISSIELAALQTAATTGRNGLGTLMVWAAGNGGGVNDRVDYDPYASSRYTMAVGAIDNLDQRAPYSEPGSSLMLVTTSSSTLFGSGPSGMYTCVGSSSVAPGTYTSSFGGTSSAAPIASGVAALVLQANPGLSARDVQHVLIRSARRVNPSDESWTLNGAGRWVSDVFGFGAIDAGAAVALAPGFAKRGPEKTESSELRSVNDALPDLDPAGVADSVVVASRLTIERVQVVLTAPHAKAGDLRITLTSPSGTSSVLADLRQDFSPGYASYVFTSVRCWDEPAAGTWTLRVADVSAGLTGSLDSWRLILIGTLPACAVDQNASNTADIDDIFLFLNRWFAGQGDFDNDGVNSIDDIFIFLNAWFQGC